MFDFLKSSDGSGKISARVNSLLLGALPVILLIAPLFGFEIMNGEEGIKTIVALVSAIELVIAGVWHLRGWTQRNFRKTNKLGAFKEFPEVS